jgi:peptidoglycan hydrolase-like protein with peptidoglycan-binding domain
MQRSSLLLAIGILASACDTDVTVQMGDFGDEAPDDESGIAYGPAMIWPRLAEGDLNQDVTTLQYLLLASGRSVSLDGRFGPGTESAVRAVQQARGLVVDGIVGEQTWLALLVEVDAGDAGPAVEAVQYLLKNRYGASLDVTGVFGATTEARLEAFQTSKCLAPTGVAGRYTWNALVARRSYCNGGGGGDTGGTGGTAAARILAAHRAGRLTLWDQTFGRYDGADPLSNMTDAAAGRAARTSCYGGAPCGTVRLSNGLLNGMAALRESYGYSYFVTAIAGASHSANSYHYAGRAFDLDTINGARIAGDSAAARSFMAACRALGAIEVLGPSNDAGHQDHIHCAW